MQAERTGQERILEESDGVRSDGAEQCPGESGELAKSAGRSDARRRGASGVALLDDRVETGRELEVAEGLGLAHVRRIHGRQSTHLGLDVVLAVDNGNVDGAADRLRDGDRLVVGDLDASDRELPSSAGCRRRRRRTWLKKYAANVSRSKSVEAAHRSRAAQA